MVKIQNDLNKRFVVLEKGDLSGFRPLRVYPNLVIVTGRGVDWSLLRPYQPGS